MIQNSPFQNSESITLEIVQKVAQSKGVDPIDLHPPLHTTIDTEALNNLFKSTKNGQREGTVRFEYNGHVVQVEADGTVEVENDTQDATC